MKKIPGILYKGTGLFLAFMMMVLTNFAQEQAVDIDVNPDVAISWFERNWVWVLMGVVALLILFSTGRRRTSTTTTYRTNDGTITKNTTVESE